MNKVGNTKGRRYYFGKNTPECAFNWIWGSKMGLTGSACVCVWMCVLKKETARSLMHSSNREHILNVGRAAVYFYRHWEKLPK